MKLVLFALVLLSSAVSSNCQNSTIIYFGNECKFLNKLITQPTLINCRIYIYIHSPAVRFFNCKNLMVSPVQEFVDVEFFSEVFKNITTYM
jgi:hypothetical protein